MNIFNNKLFQDVEYEQLPAEKMTSMSSVLLLSFRNMRRLLTSKTQSPPGAEKLADTLFDFRQDEKIGRNMRGRVSWDGRLRML